MVAAISEATAPLLQAGYMADAASRETASTVKQSGTIIARRSAISDVAE
jgi:hypothetical protein